MPHARRTQESGSTKISRAGKTAASRRRRAGMPGVAGGSLLPSRLVLENADGQMRPWNRDPESPDTVVFARISHGLDLQGPLGRPFRPPSRPTLVARLAGTARLRVLTTMRSLATLTLTVEGIPRIPFVNPGRSAKFPSRPHPRCPKSHTSVANLICRSSTIQCVKLTRGPFRLGGRKRRQSLQGRFRRHTQGQGGSHGRQHHIEC